MALFCAIWGAHLFDALLLEFYFTENTQREKRYADLAGNRKK